jgi:hypothetical protein
VLFPKDLGSGEMADGMRVYLFLCLFNKGVAPLGLELFFEFAFYKGSAPLGLFLWLLMILDYQNNNATHSGFGFVF